MLPFYIMSVVKKEKKIEFLNTIFFDVDKSPVALKGASTVFKYLRDVLQVKNVSYPCEFILKGNTLDLIRLSDRVG